MTGVSSDVYKSGILDSGPDRYWPLDDGQGAGTVNEMVSNSYGNIYGGVTLRDTDPWGNPGAATFDGVSGEIVDSASWAITAVTQPWSMEFFYKNTAAIGGMLEHNLGSAAGSANPATASFTNSYAASTVWGAQVAVVPFNYGNDVHMVYTGTYATFSAVTSWVTTMAQAVANEYVFVLYTATGPTGSLAMTDNHGNTYKQVHWFATGSTQRVSIQMSNNPVTFAVGDTITMTNGNASTGWTQVFRMQGMSQAPSPLTGAANGSSATAAVNNVAIGSGPRVAIWLSGNVGQVEAVPAGFTQPTSSTGGASNLYATVGWRIYSSANTGVTGNYIGGSYMSASTTFQGHDYSTADGAVNVNDSAPTNDGNWHHGAVTFDGSSTLSLYRDGVLQGTAPNTNTYAPQPPPTPPNQYYWRIGHTFRTSTGFGNGGWYTGSIAHVAIYSRCITSDEVATHYSYWINPAIPIPPIATKSLAYQNQVMSSGPNRYWPLDDVAGSQNAREMAASSTGAVFGGVTFGTSDPWGQPRAATFDGSSGEIIDPTAWSLTGTGASWSIEFFYKNTASFGGIIENNAGTGPGSGISTTNYIQSVNMQNNTTLQCRNNGPTGGSVIVVDTTTTNGGKWHHAAITFDGFSTLSLYRDGVVRSTIACQSTWGTPSYWRIGHTFMAGSGTGPAYYAGSIAHMAIYPRRLLPGEVASHYIAWVNSAAPTPTIPDQMVWVELLDNNLVSQGMINYSSVNAQLYYNTVGSWTVIAQYSDALWNQLMKAPLNGEFIISINWRGLFTFGGKCETPAYLDSVPGANSGGGSPGASNAGPFISLSGADYLAVIANRIVYPAPAKAWNAQLQSDGWAMINFPLETTIKQLVNVNVGPGALSNRRHTLLSIAADGGRGPAVNYTAKFGAGVDLNLLDVIRLLISNSGTRMGVSVKRRGTRIIFDVYTPRDLSSTALFSEDTGNLTSISFSLADATVTDALVRGSTTFVSQTASGKTQWNMVESFIDNGNETDTKNLTAAAQDALISGGRGPYMSTTVTDTPYLIYGRDYNLGDTVTIVVRNGDPYTDIVSGVTLTADASQTPPINVVPTIGVTGDTTASDNKIVAQLINRIKALEKKLSTK
jgi:uncharacterized protein YycO